MHTLIIIRMANYFGSIMCGIVIKFQSTYKLVVQVFGYLATYVLIEQKKLANDKQLHIM